MKTYFVYIMSNPKRTVVYTGVTNNLESRVFQHKTKDKPSSFTAKYNCKSLVYWEAFGDINEAITREKQIKGWRRIRKDRLIKRLNPGLTDLSKGWYESISTLSN